jgi:hypothetical protein
VVFDENRKGGELLDSSRNQDQLTLEDDGDTTVVMTFHLSLLCLLFCIDLLINFIVCRFKLFLEL